MTLRQFLAIVEIRTKLISVSTFILATLYAVATGHGIDPLVTFLLLIAVLAVDMGTTAFNSFFDFMRGVDDSRFSREPDKVLLHETVAPGTALLVSLALYAIAAASGCAVAFMTSWWIVPAGVAGMLVGFLYNGGPLPISRTPLGELFAGGFLGTVLFLVIYRTHADELSAHVLVASLPSTLVIASVLSVNNACDAEGDRAAGRNTLAILLGQAGSEILVYAEGLLAYATLVASSAWRLGAGAAGTSTLTIGTAPAWLPHLPAVGLPVVGAGLLATFTVYRRMHRRGYSHETKRSSMGDILLVVLFYTAAYSLATILGFARG
jgi:1,4-dihydroxy-2-naphthoate octaprenyltransferase